MKESSTYFQSYTLVVSHQKLNPLELVRIDLKFLFSYSAVQFALGTGVTDNFSHRDCHIFGGRFLMSWRYLVVLIVRFLPLIGRSLLWPSSWNRLMALLAFGSATPSFHAMLQKLGVNSGSKWRAGTRETEVRLDGWCECGLGQQMNDGGGCAKDWKEWRALVHM